MIAGVCPYKFCRETERRKGHKFSNLNVFIKVICGFSFFFKNGTVYKAIWLSDIQLSAFTLNKLKCKSV